MLIPCLHPICSKQATPSPPIERAWWAVAGCCNTPSPRHHFTQGFTWGGGSGQKRHPSTDRQSPKQVYYRQWSGAERSALRQSGWMIQEDARSKRRLHSSKWGRSGLVHLLSRCWRLQCWKRHQPYLCQRAQLPVPSNLRPPWQRLTRRQTLILLFTILNYLFLNYGLHRI